MTMPYELVLVRHGESEGQVAQRASRAGDHSYYSGEFLTRHSSLWRLTDRGTEQAEIAGKWIRKGITERFFRYYTSEYLRAKETAYHLGLPDALWYSDFYLRERDWGLLDVMSEEERWEHYSHELARKEIDGFFWSPPNGESIAQLCLRIDRVLDTLHRECSDKKVVIVCHGEVMWAFRVRLERMSQDTWRHLEISDNPHDKVHNCQILHYTRINPYVRDEILLTRGTIAPYYIAPYYSWFRSVCPWDLSLSSNSWQGIERPIYSNTDLMQEVNTVKRLISG